MQKSASSVQELEHKLQCDAHRSKIEFYCSETYCELRFLCFNCVNLPGYHQHDNKNVQSINQLLSNPVDDSILINESNFLSKCVELRNIVNSMPETVASILDISKKILARLKGRKQSGSEDNSLDDPKKQKLRTLNNEIIQQIKSHVQGKSLDSIKSSVKEALLLQNELQRDALWSAADATQNEYANVNYFMDITHHKLKVLSEKLEVFFGLLDKPAQSSSTKETSDKAPALVEESKANIKTPTNSSKTRTSRGSQLEIDVQNKQDGVIKEEQRKAILEKITVYLQNDSKVPFKELEQMVAVAGPSNVELKQIYEKANALLKTFDKIAKKPETLKNTVRETLSHFTPSIETPIQISLLNTIDYAFEGLEKLVTEKISGKPDINQLKLLHSEMKASKIDFSKQLETLQKAINDCETIRTKLLTVLDQAKKGKENIKISVFTDVMLESLDLFAKPSESNNSLTIFFETLCVKCKLGFFRKAIVDHKTSLAIQGSERRNPFVKSFSTDEVKGVLAIVDKMWFFDFEEDEEMIFQTLKNCKLIEIQLTNELKQNSSDKIQQMQPLIELCDQTPFSFPQIFIVMERLNKRMFLTPQVFDVKQEADSQVNEEAMSDRRRSSYPKRHSLADDSELIASLSRNSKEPSRLEDSSAQPTQVNIKIEEIEIEKKQPVTLSSDTSQNHNESQKLEQDKDQSKQPNLGTSETAHPQNVGFVAKKASSRRESLNSLHRKSIGEIKLASKSSSNDDSLIQQNDDEEVKDQPRKFVKTSKTDRIVVVSPRKASYSTQENKNVTQNLREQSKAKLIKLLKENPIFVHVSEDELLKHRKNIELNVFDKFYLQNDSYIQKITRISEVLEKLKNFKFLSELIVKSSFNIEKLEHLEHFQEPDFIVFEKEAEKLLTAVRNDLKANGHQEQTNSSGRKDYPQIRATTNSSGSGDEAKQVNQQSRPKRRTQSELVSTESKLGAKDLQQNRKVSSKKLQSFGADQAEQLANNLPENEKHLVTKTLIYAPKDQNGKAQNKDSGGEGKKTPSRKEI